MHLETSPEPEAQRQPTPGLRGGELRLRHPANTYRRICDGILYLDEPVRQDGIRMPIDCSFHWRRFARDSEGKPCGAGSAQADGRPCREALLQRRPEDLDAVLTTIWSETQAAPSLDQPVVPVMDDAARWMSSQRLPGVQRVPDVRSYRHAEGRRTIRPEGVHSIPGGAA